MDALPVEIWTSPILFKIKSSVASVPLHSAKGVVGKGLWFLLTSKGFAAHSSCALSLDGNTWL